MYRKAKKKFEDRWKATRNFSEVMRLQIALFISFYLTLAGQ